MQFWTRWLDGSWTPQVNMVPTMNFIFISILLCNAMSIAKLFNDLVNDQCCELLRPFEIGCNRTSTNVSPLVLIFNFFFFLGQCRYQASTNQLLPFSCNPFSYITLLFQSGEMQGSKKQCTQVGISCCGTINFLTAQHSARTYRSHPSFPITSFSLVSHCTSDG